GAATNADHLAGAIDLDLQAAGWRPSAEAYFGRITKAQILEAVREAKGEEAADRIASLRRPEMAKAAEDLLQDCDWLPAVLRTPIADALATIVVDDPAAPAIAAE
ncbi:MAG TPA: chromosome partitioning protein ParB, partial [Parvularculaceae bacterium]|nr:chromosome partitioning protein ParB [Parvularculaceae bacterium]